jgi:hypothetical protein
MGKLFFLPYRIGKRDVFYVVFFFVHFLKFRKPFSYIFYFGNVRCCFFSIVFFGGWWDADNTSRNFFRLSPRE